MRFSKRFYRQITLQLCAALFVVAGPYRVLEAQTSIPRTAEGKPDLTGFWQVLGSPDWNIQAHSAEKGIPASLGIVEGDEIPYQPWAAKQQKENYKNRNTADPDVKSYVPGVPRITYKPFPFQIVQTPKKLVILYEFLHASRQLRLAGERPEGHIDWWLGDSRAHWEGDTLVVDVSDFDEHSWFDHAGNFHSDALHVTERYSLLDADHIQYEATIDDPKVFTAAWKVSVILYRHREKNFQLLDYEGYAFDYEKYYP
jgi:hypothetical protein